MNLKITTMKQYIIFNVVMIAVLNISHRSADGKTFFITPSSSKPCPANLCPTLSQIARNSSSLLSYASNATLTFLKGSHTLDTNFSVSGISSLQMITSTFSGGIHTISCQHQVSFHFENVTELLMNGLTFIGCGSNTFSHIRDFMIENSTFQGHNISSAAFEIIESNLKLTNSSFLSNRVGHCLNIFDLKTDLNRFYRVGGAIFVSKSNINIIKCTFANNSAEIGGAMYSDGHGNISINNSTFISNQATTINSHTENCNGRASDKQRTVGGAVAIFNTTMIINSSIFINNTSVAGEGGALCIEQRSVTHIHGSEFSGNSANTSGGVFFVRESDVLINRSNFQENNASEGGVMHLIQHSTITLINNTYTRNFAELSGGVASIDQGGQLHDTHGLFTYNRAHKTGGVLYAVRSELILNHSIFSFNKAKESGGVMYILQSQREVAFYGFCKLMHNSAGAGGAIYAIESTFSLRTDYNFIVNLSVAFNVASESGGGIYLYQSIFTLYPFGNVVNISNNTANNNGGGMHAINSLITCTEFYTKTIENYDQNILIFSYNSAQKGGGLHMESASQLRVQKVKDSIIRGEKLSPSISFVSNSAQYGEAIYVADDTYFDVCDGRHTTVKTTAATNHAECFIQVFSNASYLVENSSTTNVEFSTPRTQTTASTVIFGGLLDRCIPDPRAEILTKFNSYEKMELDGFTYLKRISNINDTKQISSFPVRVCFCNPSGKSNCSYKPPAIRVKKGEIFNVSVVAVDQVNHTVRNVMIYSSLNHTESKLGEGQSAQVTEDACTNLTFSVYSPNTSEELILYADGPCRNAKTSQTILSILFLPCSCPIGFQRSYERSDCVCVCDSRLSPYFTDDDAFEPESLARHGTFWASFINNSDCNAGSCHESSGFLIYPYCPLDYCHHPTSNIHINFNRIDGADAQCANNRSGLLCSLCQPGLSLSHGSSRCIPCVKAWYSRFLIGLTTTLVVGILLVALLMALNLTVAIGTLNGLIFYANIIGANSDTFYSSQEQSFPSKLYSLLISWLNFRIGIDICYFKGADTYWKTWLQLVFPLYVILLVFMTIIISKYSMRFSHLIAKGNPVATLATLILFSYTKFLQITITTLSFATLNYPDGSHKRVWLPDATVEYLSGKHVILLIVAIIILIIGIAYTCTIFFWQWLLRYQDWMILKCITSQQLCHFIEPYHAPYVPKHRYWTGLLLFIRISLYLAFALNVSGNPRVNLVAIIIAVVSLLLTKGQFGRVYKSAFVDAIEMVCYANLCLFCTIRLAFGDDKITALLSGVITLLLLIVIISYHVYTTFCSKWLKRCQPQAENQLDDNKLPINSATSVTDAESSQCKPTFSVVELNLPGHGSQHSDGNGSSHMPNTESDSGTDDDNASLISADSTSPLLDTQ